MTEPLTDRLLAARTGALAEHEDLLTEAVDFIEMVLEQLMCFYADGDQVMDWLTPIQHEFRNSSDFKDILNVLVKRRERELSALPTTEENQ